MEFEGVEGGYSKSMVARRMGWLGASACLQRARWLGAAAWPVALPAGKRPGAPWQPLSIFAARAELFVALPPRLAAPRGRERTARCPFAVAGVPRWGEHEEGGVVRRDGMGLEGSIKGSEVDPAMQVSHQCVDVLLLLTLQ